jgi:hypothetical protein
METVRIREVTDAEIDQLLSEMDGSGAGRLRDIVPHDTIKAARAYVAKELHSHSNEYFSYCGREAVAGSVIAHLGSLPALHKILVQVYERGTRKIAPAAGLYQVLRVVTGKTGLRQAYLFHFDAYVVTAVVPIAIPRRDHKRGDLIVYPKLRRVRKRLLLNLLEKLLLQNALARRAVRLNLIRRILGAKVLRMKPGDMYFFWGYQSLHANEPCAIDSVRATVSFHFGDPHENSVLAKYVEARHQKHQRALSRPVIHLAGWDDRTPISRRKAVSVGLYVSR